jgi:hypothetical protein
MQSACYDFVFLKQNTTKVAWPAVDMKALSEVSGAVGASDFAEVSPPQIPTSGCLTESTEQSKSLVSDCST